MQYRVLGNTRLQVSHLSFGASSLGGVFRSVDETECLRTVRVALDGGVNLIDVSPYYGITRAETMLGRGLKGIPRDRYYLATKVGRYGDDEFDFSPARVTRSVDESLSRIGVDYIDIVECHDIEYTDIDRLITETIPALRRLQETGKVRFVGVTGFPLKIFFKVLGKTDVDTILTYCHYSLNDDTLLDILPDLQKRGVGVINASPLSAGLLSRRGTPDWQPASTDLKVTFKQIVSACYERGLDVEKLAVQYCLSNPAIPTTLVGTANPDHMARNLRWAEEPIDSDKLEAVLKALEPVHNRTWVTGRPENN